jgi:outer membrane protein OmpA-like peptidoglycan-associated protein
VAGPDKGFDVSTIGKKDLNIDPEVKKRRVRDALRLGAVLLIGVVATSILIIGCRRTSLMAIGTETPPTIETVTRWSGDRSPDIVFRSATGTSLVLRVDRTYGASAVTNISIERGVRYAYIIQKLDESFGSRPEAHELSNEQMKAVDKLSASRGIASVTPLRMKAPLYKLDRLTEAVTRDSAPPHQMVLGGVLNLTISGLAPGAATADSHSYAIQTTDGLHGVLSIAARKDGQLFGEIAVAGTQFSLVPLGSDLYAVIQRDHNTLPPDANAHRFSAPAKSRWVPPNLFEPLSDRPTSSIAARARKNSAISVGFWFTQKAIDYIGCCVTSEFETLASTENHSASGNSVADGLGDRMQSHFDTMNKAFDYQPQKHRGLAVGFVRANADFPDSQDAYTALNQICGPTDRRTAAAMQMAHDAVQHDVDVKVLVVWNLCVVQDLYGRTLDPCGLEVANRVCPTDEGYLKHPDPAKAYCGLAADIAPDDPHQGVVVVDAACLLDGTVHHEVGHVLGGQHGNDDGPDITVLPDSARAFADTDKSLSAPYISLMGTVRECPSSKCLFPPAWSSARPERLIEMKMTDKSIGLRPLGDKDHDNEATVIGRYPIVAQFAQSRRNACEITPQGFVLPFDFNSPVVHRDGTLTNVKIYSTRTKQFVENLAAALDSYGVDCPPPQIEISGHTDDRKGKYDEYNMELSISRAMIVRTLLEPLGENRGKLCSPRGYGAEVPLFRDNTPNGRASNRRVEVTIKTGKCVAGQS